MSTAAEAIQPAPGERGLTILVPVYNEAENFPRFHESLTRHVRTPYTLLVVYDREEDTTLPVARRLMEADPSIVLLKNQSKGVIGALKTGLKHPGGEAVVVTMADCSDDHSQVDEMFQLFKAGHHVVAPSRYARGGRQQGGPLVKRSLSRLAGTSLRYVAGVPTADATNNFKLYSRTLLDQVEIESEGGFEIALELTVKAFTLGLPIAELPTTWTDRVAGKSNFKLMKWLPFYLRWYGEAFRHRARTLL